MAIDIDFYKQAYFAFEEPVPYKLSCGKTIEINPVLLKDSHIFMTSYSVLDIDKNSYGTVEEIQMSYLEYLYKVVLQDTLRKDQLFNICFLCMGFNYPIIRQKGKDYELVNIVAEENEFVEFVEDFFITAKEFDEIKKIILYQNLLNYDDEYIDPQFKASMDEYDEMKNKDIEPITLERRMAIIASHTGITFKEQKQMTLRSHSLLFNEVRDEVEYIVAKPLAMYAGKADEVQWIIRHKHNKFDKYTTSIEDYNRSMGGNGNVPISESHTNLF